MTLYIYGGSPEIIVEYRAEDASQGSALQTTYEADASFPRNGQAVAFDTIRLGNVRVSGTFCMKPRVRKAGKACVQKLATKPAALSNA